MIPSSYSRATRESSIHFMRHWWDYSVNPARIAVRRASSIWPYPNNANRVQTKSAKAFTNSWAMRSEEHTSELQSRFDLVCRLLLEKKNKHARSDRAQH